MINGHYRRYDGLKDEEKWNWRLNLGFVDVWIHRGERGFGGGVTAGYSQNLAGRHVGHLMQILLSLHVTFPDCTWPLTPLDVVHFFGLVCCCTAFALTSSYTMSTMLEFPLRASSGKGRVSRVGRTWWYALSRYHLAVRGTSFQTLPTRTLSLPSFSLSLSY